MEQNLPTNLLDAQSVTSDSSEEQESTQTQSELLHLDITLLQQQSQALPPASIPAVPVPSKDTTKTPRKRYNRESRPKSTSQKALIQLQPISASLCFGGKSTLLGTPWEDALSASATESTPRTGTRSIKAGEQDQRTFNEKKIIAFWKKFFG